jgi:hypothetical protein
LAGSLTFENFENHGYISKLSGYLKFLGPTSEWIYIYLFMVYNRRVYFPPSKNCPRLGFFFFLLLGGGWGEGDLALQNLIWPLSLPLGFERHLGYSRGSKTIYLFIYFIYLKLQEASSSCHD